MNKLKHLAVALIFLGLAAGCGCGDSGGNGTPPQSVPAEFRMASEFPPCPLPIPPGEAPICEIDVFFLMDDSAFMNAPNGMGLIPNNPQDNRSRQLVARRVFEDLRERLKDKVEQEAQTLKDNGIIPDDTEFDFAFGVGRYEDYGATGVEYVLFDGVIDGRASPFMLNMPLLRELHPEFGARFFGAINDTVTLSDGNPTLDVNSQLRQDPQSAMEALYQIATGDGFDGNGNDDTTDNGAPCSDLAQVLPGAPFEPIVPGVPPDVPAVTYGAPTPDPQDATRSEYPVLDENGVQGDDDCTSSGNVGGAGWRDNSVRFVLVASDIATIGVFDDVPLIGELVTGVDTSQVPKTAFNGVTGRWGAAGGNNSPVNAAQVQETVDALVGAGIELLCLGAPGVLPGQTKPNLPNDAPPDGVPAVQFPQDPAFTPYTWMSAMSILTGSRISDDSNQFAQLLPAVFNLGNVGLLDDQSNDPVLGAPTFATDPTDDVLNGLVERILDRIQEKDLQPGTNGGPYPPLPTMTVEFEIEMEEDVPGFLFTRTAGFEVETVTVEVPTYYSDGMGNDFTVDDEGNPVPGRPLPRVVVWSDWAYALTDPNQVSGTDQLPFNFVVRAVDVSDPEPADGDQPGNETQVQQVLAKLLLSTPGLPPQGVPLTGAVGLLSLTGYPDDTQGTPRAVTMVPLSYNGWCSALRDLTWGANFPLEDFGTCTDIPPVPGLP